MGEENKKNIAFVIRKSAHGGGEILQQYLIRNLYNHGMGIHIITWSNVSLPNFTIPFVRHDLPRKSNGLFQFISDLFILVNKLPRTGLDKIVLFGPSDRFIIASMFSKVKCVVSLRVDLRFPKNSHFLRYKRLFYFYLTDIIIFQTHRIVYDLPRKLRKKSIVIPNPCLHKLTSEKKNVIRKNIIVAIGRLSIEKRMNLIIDAFGKLENSDWELRIYGEGPEKVALESYIEERKLKDRVFLMGYTQNISDALLEAKVFILASVSEGMPNALIDAMSHGLACIAVEVPSGGTSELIVDNWNGILIKGNDIRKKITENLRVLINNKSDRLFISRNAKSILVSHSSERIIAQWVNVLNK